MNSGDDKVRFCDLVHEKWKYIQLIIIFFVVICLMVSIFTVDSTSKFIGIFTPLIVGGMTAWVAWNQFQLSKEQKEISKQQADIAKKNKKIAKNKLKLELFEKRYSLFDDFVHYFSYCHDLNLHINHYINLSPIEEENYTSMSDRQEFIRPIYERALALIKEIKSYNDEEKIKLQVSLAKTRFLFDDNIYRTLLEFSKETHSYGYDAYLFLRDELDFYKDHALGNSVHNVSDISNLVEKRTHLAEKFNKKITNELRPFLKITWK